MAALGEAITEHAGGLQGEGHGEDVFRFAMVMLEQMVDALNDCAGLATARAGEHEEMAAVGRMDDDAALSRGEVCRGHSSWLLDGVGRVGRGCGPLL
jgi:hypothetical protein